jgi:hypothetical protein
MDHVDAYLVIPPEVARPLGGLTWSLDGEAIRREDGSTFALTEELLRFLEGFSLGRPLVPFGYLLLAFGLVRGRWGPKPGANPTVDHLREAYQTQGRAERNAGSFFAALLDDLPVAVEPPQPWEFWRRAMLNANDRLQLTTQALTPQPLRLGPEPFQRVVETRLAAYRREDLEHWMKTGSGPVASGTKQLVDALADRVARSLEGLLGQCAERKRLIGALPLVEQLSAALTLPPRKLISPELPLGGYSDVTTRGHPDQLLLSQFALDELELLRRLAERELLYYRREEPRAEVREELVVVLDQGVRTWGAPRLVLLAATFVLARLAEQRRQPLRIACTGRGGTAWNPQELPPEELARRLEIADLSEHPGLTLEGVLEESVEQPRDVVLLTHPRTLDDPSVQAAASRVQPGARLFALTADREGHASLGEFQHGRCVPIRTFRVDLDVRLPRREGSDYPGWNPWQGTIEANPCLFFLNPGPGQPTRFTFDAGEKHLLLALTEGILMLVPLHGRAQLLPRAQVGGGILLRVQWLHGLAGAFLVGGVSEGGMAVVARYDLTTRQVRSWVLGPAGLEQAEWGYVDQLECVIRSASEFQQSLDLASSEQRRYTASQTLMADGSRASKALMQSDWGTHSGWIPLLVDLGQKVHGESWIELHPDTGRIEGNHRDRSLDLLPLENGEPTLRGASLRAAQWRGDILALQVDLPANSLRKAGPNLLIYRVPERQLIHHVSGATEWTLSPSGDLLAFITGHAQVEIRGTRPEDARKQVTPRCRLDFVAHVSVGEGWLVIHSAGHTNLVHWSGGSLQHELLKVNQSNRLAELGLSSSQANATEGRPAFLGHDPKRYSRVLLGRLVAAVDSYGVVSLFNSQGHLLAQVYARGPNVAFATPSGEAFGHPSLLGRPATLEADRRIAEILRAAEQETLEVLS